MKGNSLQQLLQKERKENQGEGYQMRELRNQYFVLDYQKFSICLAPQQNIHRNGAKNQGSEGRDHQLSVPYRSFTGNHDS